jgi:hypothetical protein
MTATIAPAPITSHFANPPNHSLVPTRLPPQGDHGLACQPSFNTMGLVPVTPRGTVRGRWAADKRHPLHEPKIVLVALVVLALMQACTRGQPSPEVTLPPPTNTPVPGTLTPTRPSWHTTLVARWTQQASATLAAVNATASFIAGLPPTTAHTPTPTFTPTSTLSPANQNAFVLGLLANNGNCVLPCILGVLPGVTTLDEFADLFAPVAVHMPDRHQLSYPSHTHSEPQQPDRSPFLRLTINRPTPGVPISRVDMSIQFWDCPPVDNPVCRRNNDVARAATQFSIANILAKYGPPDDILLTAKAPNLPAGIGPWFDYFVIYDSLGFAIAYYRGGTPVNSKGVFTHCFSSDALHEIQILAQPADDPSTPLSQFEFESGWSNGYVLTRIQERGVLPLEQATGVSINSLYTRLTRLPGMCLESQASSWGD